MFVVGLLVSLEAWSIGRKTTFFLEVDEAVNDSV
jgi:hypothetical protein